MNLAATPAKIALLGQFILREANWDAQAEAWSRLIPHDWPGEHGSRLGEMITSGRADLVELVRHGGENDGERIGFLLFRIDTHFTKPELAIIAAFSCDATADVTALCLGEIERLAADRGCATVRFNTMRPGLIAKTLGTGWRVSEVIMRKNSHG